MPAFRREVLGRHLVLWQQSRANVVDADSQRPGTP
jgi:hypothetical protein